MRDELGNRMKEFYENRTRIKLPRRTHTIIRIDGKAFHTYTRGLKAPFDDGLINDMDETAKYLCSKIQGAKLGFVQSDEISILLTDFETHKTDAWFDGNIQKIVSVSASLAASKFNQLRLKRIFHDILYDCEFDGSMERQNIINVIEGTNLADFDARTFTIPSRTEVMNYFIWRQGDTVRNSISSVAQSHFSNEELKNKNITIQKEMIEKIGDDWNNYDAKLKRGRFIVKREVQLNTPYISEDRIQYSYTRNRWVSEECPIFSEQQEYLLEFIPEM